MDTEPKKTRKWLVVISLLVILAAAGIFGFFFRYYNNRLFDAYQVENEMKRNDSNTVQYLPYNGDVLKYSKDGASAFDAEGTVLWNGGYEMDSPAADICGEYVVIYNIGGKELYVYNGSDSGTRIETTLPIVKAKVAGQGVVAVLLEDTESNRINLYNPYSNTTPLLVEVPTNISSDGYPVDFDISEDGNSLVTAYLVVKSGKASNQVSFYNFTEVGQDKNRLVGAKTFEEAMVTKVMFTGEDRVVIFSQNGFCVFEEMKRPTEKLKKTFEDEITSVVADEDYTGVILNKKNESKKLQLYDYGGKEILNKTLSYEYENVKLFGEELIFLSARQCYILRSNGNEKFRFSFDRPISYLYPSAGNNRYLLIDENNMQEIKLSGG